MSKPKPPVQALTHVSSELLGFEQAALAIIGAKRSPGTRTAYRSELKRWVTFCVQAEINPLQPPLVQTTTFRDRLLVSAARDSARRTLAAMSSIYKTLLQGGVVRSNPFHPALLAWPPAAEYAKTPLVSETVALAMIADAEADTNPWGLRDAAILQLLWDTGLRRSSVGNLLRKNYRNGKLRTFVKGDREVEIDLPPESIAALDRWLRAAPQSMYVFPGHVYPLQALIADLRQDHPIDPSTINRLVTLRAEAVGAEGVHPHCFRAAFATAGYDAELPEYEIQAGMHHKDAAMTKRYDRGARGARTAVKIAQFRGKKP